ncbi:hypothetical protein KY290_015547 [Solanum tuberosum]|uniref:Tetracycline transporter n=1 Tax=Solanum tuberosum TaxID=4113 RepID=A0ABQ7VSU3_SOLTU|nr:hypothetical protein KY289_015192 [Solanum tuberosum]KAH0719536.1 hypothetical protein KY285_015567 [Solanum tuberosum]KAH0771566.1 hypothetical protein KY290_015547 [Solanum tuberosum]
MDAICPCQDKCSLAIYLSGFQQAADCMSEENRASAIATVAGVGSAAFLCSTFVYFLRARFQHNKDNFSILMLICYGGTTFSQLVLLPKLARIVREETILSLALIAGFSNMLIDSIAWEAWVPYVVALFPMFLFLAKPALQSIVSKQVGPNEQVIAQGCISGVSSFANILSPFIFSPLTDLFLSERAPFDYPGFSMFCIGLAWDCFCVHSNFMSEI